MTLNLQNAFIRHLATTLTSVGIILGFGWTVFKPHAEDFVVEVTEDRIGSISKKVDNVSRQATDNSRDIKVILQEQQRAKEDRGEIKELINDQRKLSERILFEIKR